MRPVLRTPLRDPQRVGDPRYVAEPKLDDSGPDPRSTSHRGARWLPAASQHSPQLSRTMSVPRDGVEAQSGLSMSSRMASVLVGLLLLLAAYQAVPQRSRAHAYLVCPEGPHHGRVVDAETGQPLAVTLTLETKSQPRSAHGAGNGLRNSR